MKGDDKVDGDPAGCSGFTVCVNIWEDVLVR